MAFGISNLNGLLDRPAAAQGAGQEAPSGGSRAAPARPQWLGKVSPTTAWPGPPRQAGVDGLPGADPGGRGVKVVGNSPFPGACFLARGPLWGPRNRDSTSGQRNVCGGQAPVPSLWSGSDHLCILISLVTRPPETSASWSVDGQRVCPPRGWRALRGQGVPRLCRAGAEACVTEQFCGSENGQRSHVSTGLQPRTLTHGRARGISALG